ncbi:MULTISPECIES: tRNA uridine-5-carboxymethylaminomethyl(34) synthesis GTPase MnmE [Pelosinus]|uniref:tRNA modification GTPase MnmE n=1 Tax=Pelosinus fermentans B4 TaxID=1149862 RepID=I9LAY2_9FIRM|nr:MULTISPECIES: tRNA uridine-5-carboxymethylaminomethyl(34) synthesis GTPase MnmE [Pelosinus]EIW17584.1 tRNA modification GTPase TrmE [Pelosinus fermentans B4]EIW23321.1 tRNA modification GTPase mnmE [Pelosinus fermentans A11]OAM92139.1 tRNA modification GTPase mnmE [Pelosinus fermentans DSM 17108]SDQ34607.1 tRNA modification GTPase trmE [Pelosinus fermentans]
MFAEDTISTIATAPGEGAIGIIRMSGSLTIKIAETFFRGINGKNAGQIASQQVAYGHIIDPDNGLVIDEVLLLVMHGPKSYTREDVVEIHCHGGPVPMKKILALTLQYGARLSEPGEFTKRAFLNGRLDLSQAEAVMDIIRAKTDASLRMAVGHLSGALSDQIRKMRYEILRMIANLEATIDFPEEDIEVLAAQDVRAAVVLLLADINHLLLTKETGRILREGLETVILGKPNVGKSSLLNALLKEKRAIVTDIPGTTRDVIEEFVNLSGVPLKIVDTAGIRETSDIIEQMGVEKAKEFVVTADLILLLLDASLPLSAEDREVLTMLSGKQAIVLVNKTDLPALLNLDEVYTYIADTKVLKISVMEGTGLAELEQMIVDMVYGGEITQKEGAFLTNLRQANLLEQAKYHLEATIATIDEGMPSDCIVIDLKESWDKLGEITGDTVGEDIIDQIFTQFCIGK